MPHVLDDAVAACTLRRLNPRRFYPSKQTVIDRGVRELDLLDRTIYGHGCHITSAIFIQQMGGLFRNALVGA